jgi:hypothetical protein
VNSIEYVDTLKEALIQKGASKPEIVRSVSKACVGWPYVFGAWGEQCTPSGRKRRAREDHPTIVSACQVLSGKKSSCSGCKWDLPVRMYDCRGFTDWCLNQVGIDIQGSGATSQWNTAANWEAKGTIDTVPEDVLVCLFVHNSETGKKEHTGFGYRGSTCECSSGVQYFEKRKAKWTHWAVPKGIRGETPAPEPSPDPGTKKPTLRKGDAGPYVTLAQTELIQRGYDLGSWGADGKFGNATEKAVKQFQQDWGLAADGVIGQKTWAMLDSTPVKVTYKVTIPHMSLGDAEALVKLYPGAVMEKEGDA